MAHLMNCQQHEKVDVVFKRVIIKYYIRQQKRLDGTDYMWQKPNKQCQTDGKKLKLVSQVNFSKLKNRLAMFSTMLRQDNSGH